MMGQLICPATAKPHLQHPSKGDEGTSCQRVAKLATPTLLVLLTAEEGRYDRSEILCTKTLYNDVDLGLLHIKNIDLPQKLSRNTKIHKPRVLRSGACTIAEVLAET